jgi:drug/metabolite transporter (DMT)-like permease
MPPPPSSAASADEIVFAPSARLAPALPAPDPALVGIGLIIASTIFFSAGDIAAKFLTESLPSVQVAWLRYLVFILVAIPTAVSSRGRNAFSTDRPVLQVLRGLAVVISSLFFMLGLEHLEVAETTAINFISPIFITALSIPLLGERVGLRRFGAALVGFAGVMIIIRPGSSAFQAAALFPVCAALIWAFAAIATRLMSNGKPETTLAYTSVVGFALLTCLAPFEWHAMSLEQVGLGILTGLGSTIGHIFVIRGYRLASASLLAPYSYVQLIFASVLGFLAFGSIPGTWTLIGGAVIAASGLYTANRERVRALESRRAALEAIRR